MRLDWYNRIMNRLRDSSASATTVARAPHAQTFAGSASGLALFGTNNELAIGAVRDRGKLANAQIYSALDSRGLLSDAGDVRQRNNKRSATQARNASCWR